MKDVAVFGIGKLGKTFAVTYSKKGGKVFAIDRRQERVDGIAEDVTYAIRADVTEENVVENLGINNVDAVVVALGNNFEASIIVTTICKSLGIPYIVASAMDKLQADVLMKIGADHVILPESETGKRVANGRPAARTTRAPLRSTAATLPAVPRMTSLTPSSAATPKSPA